MDGLLTGRQNLVLVGELSDMGRAASRARATELLALFDLTDAADRVLKGYSGGMRRRLDLAASLMTRPPVLFLDEPTTGLDPTSRQRVWEAIRELLDEGVTVLLTTQYLDEADALANRIVVIDHGRVIADGTPQELKEASRSAHLEVTLATAHAGAASALAPLVDRPDPRQRRRAASQRRRRQLTRVCHLGRARPRRGGSTGRQHRGPPAVARRRVLLPHRRAHRGGRGRDAGHGSAETQADRARAGRSDRMTTTTLTQTQVGAASRGRSAGVVWGRVQDVWAMTRRNLVHISREPMQLSDVTIQPVLFTVLFIFIFGGGIPIPGGGSYKDFVLAGLLALNLVTSTMGTAVGLSTDLHEGMIDRFRTLPMWRAAVLVGRSIADLMTSVLCAVIVALTGLAVGWRADASFMSVIGGFALVLFFAYSLSWIAACVGLNSKSPESAASFGFIVLFPLAFVSNAMVPTQHMPGWLQVVADWNPVSAVTAGARNLWGNPNPSGTIQAWPMQHPVEAALIWSVVILAVAAPLASHFFKRRTTE